jgi:hypothetical protein
MKKLDVSLCVAMVAVLGCSLSDSSGSISDSVSSPFEMMSDSSKSSSGEDADTAYRDDVSDHTRTVVAAGGSADDVAGDLGPLARRHGISDWEARDSTYEALGRGLALGGIDGGDLRPYEQRLAADPRRAALLRRGFAAVSAEQARP